MHRLVIVSILFVTAFLAGCNAAQDAGEVAPVVRVAQTWQRPPLPDGVTLIRDESAVNVETGWMRISLHVECEQGDAEATARTIYRQLRHEIERVCPHGTNKQIGVNVWTHELERLVGLSPVVITTKTGPSLPETPDGFISVANRIPYRMPSDREIEIALAVFRQTPRLKGEEFGPDRDRRLEDVRNDECERFGITREQLEEIEFRCFNWFGALPDKP